MSKSHRQYLVFFCIRFYSLNIKRYASIYIVSSRQISLSFPRTISTGVCPFFFLLLLLFFLFSSFRTDCGPTGYENTSTTKNTPRFVHSTYTFNNVNQLTVDKREKERERYRTIAIKKSVSMKVKCIELLFAFTQ